jgi:hypothetical protein
MLEAAPRVCWTKKTLLMLKFFSLKEAPSVSEAMRREIVEMAEDAALSCCAEGNLWAQRALERLEHPMRLCAGCVAYMAADKDGHACPVAAAMEQIGEALPDLREVSFHYDVTECPYRATAMAGEGKP